MNIRGIGLSNVRTSKGLDDTTKHVIAWNVQERRWEIVELVQNPTDPTSVRLPDGFQYLSEPKGVPVSPEMEAACAAANAKTAGETKSSDPEPPPR